MRGLSQLEIRRDLKMYETKLNDPNLSDFMRDIYKGIRKACLDDLRKAQLEEFYRG